MNNNLTNGIKALAFSLGIATLGGCGHFPGAYTLPIEQGNAIKDSQVEQLRVGMTTDQVRFLLGTPMLENIFNKDRWDYVYYSTEKRKLKEKRHLVVYFQEGQVSSFEGDLIAHTGEDLA